MSSGPIQPAEFRSGLLRLADRAHFEIPGLAFSGRCRRSAVLLPFWEERGSVKLALIRRSRELPVHAGEVAFAGGGLHEGEGSVDAALREAHEEIGLEPSSVDVIGRLDDAWSGAGHHMAAVVGWLPGPPALRAAPEEVEAILVADLAELLDPAARDRVEYFVGGETFSAPSLELRGEKVFGVTVDLFDEAIAWGHGESPSPGAARLLELEAFLRVGELPATASFAVPRET